MTDRRTSIAKITRPNLPNVLRRERLFRLLDQGTRQAIWVSGPAGSGKTTLVGSWLDSRALPCLWYQADEGDADLASFFYYLGLAAKKAAPGHKRPLPLLTPEYAHGLPSFTRGYFEQLYRRLKPPAVLIVDNYQEAPEASRFHEAVIAGLSALPEGIQAVVISRAEPPQTFTGLLASGRLHAIGWNDLQLTPGETKDIVRLQGVDRRRLGLSAWMHEKTGGWAAGLVLLAQAVKTENIDPEAFKDLPPEKVFAYFRTELFDRADAALKTFLLKTALIPEITPQVAARLTGHEHAGRVLYELNTKNHFTERRRQPALTYLYHPLFREFLLTRAKETFCPKELLKIQTQGASLLEESGRIEDAAELYLQARAWRELSALVVKHAQAFIMQGRNSTVAKWIRAVPWDLRERSPWVLFWQGAAHVPFQLLPGRDCFERAYRLFKQTGDLHGACLAWSGYVNTFFIQWDSFIPLDSWLAELEDVLRLAGGSLPKELEALVAPGVFTALFFRRPDHPDLPAWEEKTLALAGLTADVNQRMIISNPLILYYTWIGALKRLDAALALSRPQLKGPASTPLTRALWHMLEAVQKWFMAESEACVVSVETGLSICAEHGVYFVNFRAHAQAAFSALTAGDLAASDMAIGRIEPFVRSLGRLDLGQYHQLLAYRSALSGDSPRAVEHEREALRFATEAGVPFAVGLELVGLAHALFALGERIEARACLRKAAVISGKMKSALMDFLRLSLEAHIAFASGEERAGLLLLKRTFRLGSSEGFVNTPWWLPEKMAGLCARALEHGIEIEYARMLIRKRKLVPEGPIRHIDNWPWPVKIFTLGGFRLLIGDKPVSFSGKAQKKPLELLKAILAFGGGDVSDGLIIDALWPDADGDTARSSFKTTLHRLRRLIGAEEPVKFQDGRLTLDPGLCWTDVGAFEEAVESAEFEVRSEKPGKQKMAGKTNKNNAIRNPQSEMSGRLEKALQLYRGPFLPEECGTGWSLAARERLKRKFLGAVERLGAHCEGNREFGKAIEHYHRGLETDDLAEELYLRLMRCQVKMGRRAEAAKTYRRCRHALTSELGVEPSLEMELLSQSLSHI